MGKVEEKQRAKRKELALKAIPIIDKYGFNTIGIKDLCEKIDVSVGTFYHYFNDKNDIIMEFFILIDEYFKQIVEPKINKNNNSLLNLRIVCHQYAYYSHSCGFEVCRQISTVPLISINKDFISEKRYMHQLIYRLISVGQEKGQITYEYSSEQLSNILLNMLRGYCADWCKMNGSYDIISAIDLNCSLYLKQIANDKDLLHSALETTIEMHNRFEWFI